jgi:hypothetical protein
MWRPLLLILAPLVFLLAGCSDRPPDPIVAEWRAVLDAKKLAAGGEVAAKQKYADLLVEFLKRHPNHPRARTVYRDLQLDRAGELSAAGDHLGAAEIYGHLVSQFPKDRTARESLAAALDLTVVSRDELKAIEKGMTHDRVVEILGPPRKGWRREAVKNGVSLESLFYKNEEGGVAAVHFERGRVFAVDYESEPQSR